MYKKQKLGQELKSRVVERCRIVKVAGKGESNWSTEETRKKAKNKTKQQNMNSLPPMAT